MAPVMILPVLISSMCVQMSQTFYLTHLELVCVENISTWLALIICNMGYKRAQCGDSVCSDCPATCVHR